MKTQSLPMNQSYKIELYYKRPLFHEMVSVKKPKDADRCLRKCISASRIDHKEFFWVILLTSSSNVLGVSQISSGKTDATNINFKELIQLVALSNACAVIIAHNHPSGNLEPSTQDKSITKKCEKILDLIDVALFDHIIITSEGYYSFVDAGLITKF